MWNVWLYVLCGLIAILGRLLGQALAARKELANRNRQYRLERLVDAWRSIELAAGGTSGQPGLEGALRDIQLLGTASQVDTAARLVQVLDRGLDPLPLLVDLLEALRGDLRSELRLNGQVTPLALTLPGAPSKTCPRALEAGLRSRISLLRTATAGEARTSPARAITRMAASAMRSA